MPLARTCLGARIAARQYVDLAVRWVRELIRLIVDVMRSFSS